MKPPAKIIDKDDFDGEKAENKEFVKLFCEIQHIADLMDF